MKNRRVLQEWAKFQKSVFHRAPPELLPDLKISFYGGVAIFYRILTDLAPGDEPTQADLDILSDIDAELKEFATNCKVGRI